jgi:hypothetical protein
MADRYWVTGGDHNFHSTSNWSATSGGASGASVPTTGDTAHFDANSGTYYHSEVYAPILCQIDTTGILDGLGLIIDNGGSLSMQADLSGFYCIEVKGTGSLTTNNYNITVTDIIYFGDTAVVTLGTSVLSVGVNVFIQSSLYIDPTITLDADESTINFYMANQESGINDSLINCYDQDLGNVNIYVYNAPANPDLLYIAGDFTCETLSITGDGEVRFNGDLVETEIITINTESGLILEGDTEGGLVLYNDQETGVFSFSMASGTCSAVNSNIGGITATGGATFDALAGDGNIDSGGNTGWDFGLQPIHGPIRFG